MITSMGERLVRRASDLSAGRKFVNVRAGTVQFSTSKLFRR